MSQANASLKTYLVWPVSAAKKDGEQFTLRPIRPDDLAKLFKLHARISSDSVYMRYLCIYPLYRRQDEGRLVKQCTNDEKNFAVVAVQGNDIIGVARYVEDKDDPHSGELAFLVVDDEQGKGVGRALFRVMMDWVKTEKLQVNEVLEVHADMHGSNSRMAKLFRENGFLLHREEGYHVANLHLVK